MTTRVLASAFALAAVAGTQAPDRGKLQEHLAALLQQRSATARQEVADRTKESEAGRGSPRQLLAAQYRRRLAELELGDDPRQIVAAHEQAVAALREIERAAKVQADAGRLSAADYAQCQAETAAAEAELVQSRALLPDADKAKLSARLDELRRNRLAAIRAVADVRQKEFEVGRAGVDSVLEAQVQLARAELDLTADPQKRQQILERVLKGHQDAEQASQAQYNAGRIPVQELIRTRGRRLDAEIALGGERVAELRQELVTLLRQEVDAATQEFQAGRAAFDTLVDARVRLGRAEQALTEDPRRRTAIQDRVVKALADLEKLAQAQFDSGRISAADLAEARFIRLTAEIDLVRMQLKAGDGKKP